MKKSYTLSEQATKKLAHNVAKKLKAGEILALSGDLGSGKTTFVQGLAEYFGIKEHVSSPTFTLINEYTVKNPNDKIQMPNQVQSSKSKNPKTLIHDSRFMIRTLVHIDCYRLESPQELINIGFEDYLNRKDLIIIIEWAEKVKDILPKSTKWIYFEYGKKENERIIGNLPHHESSSALALWLSFGDLVTCPELFLL